MMEHLTEVLRTNCILVGRDLLAPLVESTYTPTRCMHCMPASGALLRQVLRTGLLECEELCEQDTGCRGFDYDTIRGLCRTFDLPCRLLPFLPSSICPSSARTNQNGCQWTIYDQPSESTESTTSLFEVNASSTTRRPQQAVAISDAVEPVSDTLIAAVVLLTSLVV